jgi:hypothetical protein
MKRDLSNIDEFVVARVQTDMINAGIVPTFNDLFTVKGFCENLSKDELKKRKRKFRKIKKKILNSKKRRSHYSPYGKSAKTIVEDYFLIKVLDEYNKMKETSK